MRRNAVRPGCGPVKFECRRLLGRQEYADELRWCSLHAMQAHHMCRQSQALRTARLLKAAVEAPASDARPRHRQPIHGPG